MKVEIQRVNTFVGFTAGLLLGSCAQWVQQAEEHDRRVREQRAPMEHQFAQEDGYASVDPGNVAAMKAGRAKFCAAIDDFMTPQGTDEVAQNNRRQEREMFQAWMSNGQAPADRYYLPIVHTAGRGEDAYLSIPLAERDELQRNLFSDGGDNFACFWTEGLVEPLPDNPTTHSMVLHLRASKWDGVLRPHATEASAAAAAADAAPSASATSAPPGQ